jgi:NTP pyrophosphatase (non-canonical NTP hydrolase)
MHTLDDIQHEVEHLIKEEWQSSYWAPLSSLARLTEEVGELAREINHSYGEKPKKSSEGRGSIASELGDILFIVAALANSIEVDLDSAFEAVMTKYRGRDAQRWSQNSHPREEAAGN